MQKYKSELKIKAWPTPQDYNEAVQNLHLNVRDPELQRGKVSLGALGLPQPITGAFASVYRVHCNGRDWALRCFLRDIPDSKMRYEKISQFVQNDQLSYTVGFDFQTEGMRIGNNWFPALKMEWVEGETLDNYLRRTKHSIPTDLAERFKTMCLDLSKAGIAHGDFQHGNIIVKKNDLYLVDYDGMFVPALAGSPANELGHRNYQHPKRTGKNFDATLDNFSAWAIYTSLHALATDPKLYEQLGAGEDCLLFRQDDYLHPLNSCAFAALENHASERVQSLAKMVRSNLSRAPHEVPPLDADLSTLPPLPTLAAGTPTSRSHPRIVVDGANTPEWLKDQLQHGDDLTSRDRHSSYYQPPLYGQSRSTGSSSGNPYPAPVSAPMPIEPELTNPAPRKVHCNRLHNARVSPMIWQFLNFLNPFLWMLVASGIALANDTALHDRGMLVNGKIESVEYVHQSKGPDENLVMYSYDVGSSHYRGSRYMDISKGATLKLGDNISVTVLEDQPTVNAPNFSPQDGSQASELVSMANSDRGTVILLGIMNFLIECFIWFVPLKHRAIVRNGIGTRGKIWLTNVVTGAKQEKHYSVEYSYTDASTGRDVYTKMSVSADQYRTVNIGDEVTVVYLPGREDKSVIYNFSYYQASP